MHPAITEAEQALGGILLDLRLVLRAHLALTNTAHMNPSDRFRFVCTWLQAQVPHIVTEAYLSKLMRVHPETLADYLHRNASVGQVFIETIATFCALPSGWFMSGNSAHLTYFEPIFGDPRHGQHQ